MTTTLARFGRPARVFISYAHPDDIHRKRLEVHLTALRREGLIAPWHDRMIEAGSEWAGAIDHNLANADIVVLLISADFLASDYCFEKELALALARHERGEANVVPVFVEPTDFSKMPFAKLQGLPRDAKPVSLWPNRDEAWLDVAMGIRAVVEAPDASSAASSQSAQSTTAPPADVRSVSITGNVSGSVIVSGSANTVDIRGNSTPGGVPAPARGKTSIKILFLGAAPTDQARLALGKEVREIGRNLRESNAGRRFEFVQEWAVRPTDLQQTLLRHRPDIVHFSGHGGKSGELLFEDDQGDALPAPAGAVSRVFSLFRNKVRCVVLNACFSSLQAEAIRSYVDCVVGMKTAVADDAAIAFASSFYLALGYGESVQTAFQMGCVQIDLAGGQGSDTPLLSCRDGTDPAVIAFVART